MSKRPSANKNLVKAAKIRSSGAKTYVHSVVDADGKQYYAERINELYREGKTAKYIREQITKEYPDVPPPSATALQSYIRRYAMIAIPAGTLDASKRPDALVVMYDALEVVQGELKKAQAMPTADTIPLNVVRSAARDVVTIAEKIVQSERAIGLPPVTVINVGEGATFNQQNVTNAQRIVINDPQKGKELLDEFKAFEQEVLDYQTGNALSAASQ
jgi:predicted RNA-binding protein with EMAP domain